MSANFIRDCDKRTEFFTGLTTFSFFTTVFEFVAPQVHRVGKLTMDELLVVLMKLWLSLLNEDLSYSFGISVSAVSRIFHMWLEVMYIRLKPGIRWPDKETVQKTLPTAYSKVLLYYRLFWDFHRASNFPSDQSKNIFQLQDITQYKFLIAITPSGNISFILRGGWSIWWRTNTTG